jgi:hypothetical protein
MDYAKIKALAEGCGECDCDPCECDPTSNIPLIWVYMAIGHAQSCGEHGDASTLSRALDGHGDAAFIRVGRDTHLLVKKHLGDHALPRAELIAERDALRAEVAVQSNLRAMGERHIGEIADRLGVEPKVCSILRGIAALRAESETARENSHKHMTRLSICLGATIPALERERDARPDITPEDAARVNVAGQSYFHEDQAAKDRVSAALRSHAAKVVPRG